MRSFRFDRKRKTKTIWKIPLIGGFLRNQYFTNLKTCEIDPPQKARREKIEIAYRRIRNREKACINCEFGFPVPYACCQLGVICMRKPPKKTKSLWKLRFYSAFARFKDASFRRDTCRKFKQRQNPELFLRRLVWIKRFIWFLNDRYYWWDIDDSYVPVAMKCDLKAPTSHVEEYRKTWKPKLTPL